jgi:glycosyltransferase involved in cell wall biosynthesis
VRIGLVSPGISRESGGTSAFMAGMASHLCGEGHSVAIVSTDVVSTGGRSQTLIPLDSRVELKLFPIQREYDKKLYRSTAMMRWMRSRITDFDVIDLTGVWSLVTVQTASLCVKAGVPYVLTPHGQMCHWDWSKGRIRKRLFFHTMLAKAWNRASAIRFCSEGEAAASVIAPSAASRKVIPNPVDSPLNIVRHAQRAALRSGAGIPTEAPVLLFLGRVDAQKGVLEIVETFTHLWQQKPDAVLLIVGPIEGSYGENVREAVHRSPARQNIRIIGPVYGEQKQAFYSIADLFITLSKNEGLPMAVLEALAMGLPTVLTPQSNMPEVAEHTAGLIVNASPEETARQIADLFVDPETIPTLKNNATGLIREHFSWDILLPRFVSMYHQAMIQGQSTETERLPNPPLRNTEVTDLRRQPLTKRA